jgi:lambda family phage portal protein
MNAIERVIHALAPQWSLRRARARMLADVLQERHYEAGGSNRRTQGWKHPKTDANAAARPYLARLRDSARDLVRNNGHAESALDTISAHAVGTGIVAKPSTANAKAADLWKAWAETTDCDSDGRADFYGLQDLVMRTVAESGECLIRRRLRKSTDGLALPIQLQVLEPDYLDTQKDNLRTEGGGRIIEGVEYDVLGRRRGYWLFKDHPGSNMPGNAAASYFVPAESVLHVFRQMRPGQVRGVTWFAPVLLRFKDYDEYADATLMKQKIAACLAVFVTDVDGSSAPMGTAVTGGDGGNWDLLEPGLIQNVPPGRTIQTVQPPTVREHGDYSAATLREIATGLGVTYEDLTGDYQAMPFSAARMSRLRHLQRVERWRWRVLIPQFCDPVWRWAMEAAQVDNKLPGVIDDAGFYTGPRATWTAPPLPMVNPDVEIRANMQAVRSGQKSLSEVIRESGYDPEEVLNEIRDDFERADKLGLVLDCDPRKTSQAGLTQARPGGTVIPSPDIPEDAPAPVSTTPPVADPNTDAVTEEAA